MTDDDDAYDPILISELAQTAFGKAFRDAPLHYFHATLEQQENIPKTGGVLLVGNHAFFGIDGLVLGMLVLRETSRYVRFLGERNLWRIPGVGRALTALGAVPGEPVAAKRLLEEGEVVGVYPGGIDDSWKSSDDRYRLKWGTRSGFAKVAMRAKVPIVPMAGHGIDDMYSIVGREHWLGRRLFGSARYDFPIAFGAFGTLVPRRAPQRYVALPAIDTQGDPDRPEDVERVRAATFDALEAELSASR